MTPLARAGVLIEKPHRIPMLGTDRVAGQFLDAQALDRAQPFLAKLLALLRVQRAKEIVEARIALVREMKLDVAAHEPAGYLEERHLFGCDEGRVRSEEHTSELQS